MVLALLGAAGMLGYGAWQVWERTRPLPLPPPPPVVVPPPPPPRPRKRAVANTMANKPRGGAAAPDPIPGPVQLGSSAEEVIRVLGNPQRVDPGPELGTIVYVYGELKLEIRDGKVVGPTAPK
jgi:hypothetical protein